MILIKIHLNLTMTILKKVSKYNWCCTKNGYVSAILPNSNRKHISLHRLIMHVKDSNIDVDHINHDTIVAQLSRQKSKIFIMN